MIKFLGRAVVIACLATSFGCIGITKNSGKFLNQPSVGMTETNLILTYGAPDFSTRSGDTSVHVYRILDRAYYVLYGYNEDVEMVVVCENGKVKEVKNMKALDTGFTLFQPSTWPVN